jgi:hypothetical protein
VQDRTQVQARLGGRRVVPLHPGPTGRFR